MENEHTQPKTIYIIGAGVIAFLLLITLFFNDRINNLERQLDYISGSVSFIGYNDDIPAMEHRIMEVIKSGSSILTSSESEVIPRSGYFEANISVVPKEIVENDKVFISLNDKRVQARSADGVSYEAKIAVKPGKTIKPYVIIENEGNYKQEVLPEVFFDQFLSVQIIGFGVTESERKILLEIGAMSEETVPFMDMLNDAELVILDDNQREIARTPFNPADPQRPGEYDYASKVRAYEGQLPENVYEENYFKVIAVLKGNGINLTSGPLYVHSKGAKNYEETGWHGFEITYDE